MAYSKNKVFLGTTHLDIVFLFLGIIWEDRILSLDHLAKLKLIIIHEWWSSYRYLVGQDS